MNDELVNVEKEAAMACLQIVSRHYSAGTEEIHGNSRQNSQRASPDWNRAPAHINQEHYSRLFEPRNEFCRLVELGVGRRAADLAL